MSEYINLKNEYDFCLSCFTGKLSLDDDFKMDGNEFGSTIWKKLLETIKKLEQRIEDLERGNEGQNNSV